LSAVQPDPPPLADPVAAFQTLEARLAGARQVRVRGHLKAEGALVADMVGELNIGQQRFTRLDFKGKIDGAAAEALLLSDGRGMNAGDAPPALVEALLVGITRMGLMHNVWKIANRETPSKAEGGVRDWVTVSDVREGPMEALRGVKTRSIEFAISVDGARVAEATLFLDRTTGLPVVRRQVVHFPEGEMRVVEEYGAFEVTGGP
jgi:hypothetical protein